MKVSPDFYRGKRVLVTGHTGFKGMWLSLLLQSLGAEVTGFSLPAPTEEGGKVLKAAGITTGMKSITGDIRDLDALQRTFEIARPEIVVHLAAQPIVLESYRDPVGTYAANVMGTVHVLECVRRTPCVRSLVNVTTDKVYQNNEWMWGYRENERLDGFDPYSNSKSCAELVTASYRRSFFADGRCAVSTARAGNVIGGGDFAEHRIIPDAGRAAYEGVPIRVRRPHSTRPYQHVLEPLYAYLLIAQVQYKDGSYADAYNVGPDDADCVTTGALMNLFCRLWGAGQVWEDASTEGPHEAQFLRLDCAKMRNTFDWLPRWHIDTAVEKTIAWAKAWRRGADIGALMRAQIEEFLSADREGAE